MKWGHQCIVQLIVLPRVHNNILLLLCTLGITQVLIAGHITGLLWNQFTL